MLFFLVTLCRAACSYTGASSVIIQTKGRAQIKAKAKARLLGAGKESTRLFAYFNCAGPGFREE